MKKTKKVIATILSVFILLAALPMAASAASAINTVEIEINLAPGINSQNYGSYMSVNTDGLVLDDVCIYDYYGDLVIDEFELGMEYEIYFYFLPEEGYEFPDSTFEFTEVSVNGEDVEFYLYSMDEDEDEYDLLEVCYTTILGGEITNVALDLDIYGDFSTDNYYTYINLLSNGTDYMYSTNLPVLVYDENGDLYEGKFEAGKEYSFKIFLSPKESCSFFKNNEDEFELDSVKVNGEDATYSVNSYETNDYYEYIVIETTATAKKANFIKDINIDISTDLAYVYVEDWENYITINTEGLEFDDDNGDPAVFAYDMYDNIPDQYLPGETYYLYIYFTPEEDYMFPEYYEFDSITVNGEERDYVDDFGIYTTEDGKEICYIGIEFVAEVEPDTNFNFFGRIISFFQNIINFFISLFYNREMI